MNRVTRMGIGLVALIPVLLLAGELFQALGVEGTAGAWTIFGVGFVWLALMTWWALRAPIPPQMSDEARGKYFAPLRQAQFKPLDESDEDATSNRT